MKFAKVTSKSPCKICGKPDWCQVIDGKISHCMRVPSNKPAGNGYGWLHVGGDTLVAPEQIIKPAATQRPKIDFERLSMRYRKSLKTAETAAMLLNVSQEALYRLETGWDGKAYTFPMRDGRENIIGIRRRFQSGKKACVIGSRNGIFWPEGVYRGSSYVLYICEGESDCAALLTLGFDVIARPSCLGSVDIIKEFLRGRRREVVIMADKDEAKKRPDGSVFYPGQEGALKLANEIKPITQGVKVIKPPYFKDIRDWLKAGATKEMVQAIANNARFIA